MKIFIFISVLFLAACQTVQPWHSPSQNYVLNGKNINITGTMNSHSQMGLVTNSHRNELMVFFNGQEVIRGSLPNLYSGEVYGSYEGRPVTALCSGEQKTRDWIDVRCAILIDEKRTVTLSF